MVMGGYPADFCGLTLLILTYSVIFLAFKSIIFHLPSGEKQTFSQDCEGFPSFLYSFSSASFNRIFFGVGFLIYVRNAQACLLLVFLQPHVNTDTSRLNNCCFNVLYYELKEIIYNWLFSLSVWRFPFPSSKSKLQAESELKVCS